MPEFKYTPTPEEREILEHATRGVLYDSTFLTLGHNDGGSGNPKVGEPRRIRNVEMKPGEIIEPHIRPADNHDET